MTNTPEPAANPPKRRHRATGKPAKEAKAASYAALSTINQARQRAAQPGRILLLLRHHVLLQIDEARSHASRCSRDSKHFTLPNPDSTRLYESHLREVMRLTLTALNELRELAPIPKGPAQ